MIKSIGDHYKIYGLIIVQITKKSLVLDYEFLNATFESPNHAFTPSVQGAKSNEIEHSY